MYPGDAGRSGALLDVVTGQPVPVRRVHLDALNAQQGILNFSSCFSRAKNFRSRIDRVSSIGDNFVVTSRTYILQNYKNRAQKNVIKCYFL